jgi:hypothetical protein
LLSSLLLLPKRSIKKDSSVVVLLVFSVIVDWSASTVPISGNLLILTLLELALTPLKNYVAVLLRLNVPTNGFVYWTVISLMLVDIANNVHYGNVLPHPVLLILLHNLLAMKIIVPAVLVANVMVVMNVLALPVVGSLVYNVQLD